MVTLEKLLEDLMGSDSVKIVLSGVGETVYRSEDVYNVIVNNLLIGRDFK